MDPKEFWNQVYEADPTRFPGADDRTLKAALKHFGDVRGASVLDLGCGNGSSSLFFAQLGAQVTAIDVSDTAINNLAQFCRVQGIDNIKAIKCSAFDIAEFPKFDFVFGSMILHHLEPFANFSEILRQSVANGGKAFFFENNAFSNLLLWFRNNLVGKYGFPKYGDDDEFPLLPAEVDLLRRYFSVNVVYPQMQFFRMASAYLFRRHFERQLEWVDDCLFRVRSLRKYSYCQYLLLS